MGHFEAIVKAAAVMIWTWDKHPNEIVLFHCRNFGVSG